jgi:SAM-dependent methyltransferase
MSAAPQTVVVPSPLKIDLGSGPNKQPGFLGVDCIAFPGVDVVLNLGSAPWPWENDSVDEAYSSHTLEHLTNLNDKWERVTFFNELYRVLKPGAKCVLIFPHWCSSRFYGDPTHKEPISEWFAYYLSRDWRKLNAAHTDKANNPNGYDCHFEVSWGNAENPALQNRHGEYRSFAMQWYKEAILDLHCQLIKR